MPMVRAENARVEVVAALATPPSPEASIVRTHLPATFRFVRSLGASRDLAGDLVQEAFVIAWQKDKQHLPAPAMAAFLRRTVRFLWLQQRRGERRAEAAIAARAEALWREECGDDGETMLMAMRFCTQLLRGRAAQAVVLAYTDGRSREVIAQSLGMQPNGVRTLLARTRRWLEQCITRRMKASDA